MSGNLRIGVMSDLHIEFDRRIGRRWQDQGLPESHPAFGPDLRAMKAARPDIVLLAGDIDAHDPMAYAEQTAGYIGVPTVFVAGNHDFYRTAFPQRLDELRHRDAEISMVHFLENSTVTLSVGDERLRVLGCTLWTDYELHGLAWAVEAMRLAKDWLNDHRHIFINSSAEFLPKDALEVHRRSLGWLEAQLREPFDGPTVVVTHHMPSGGSVPRRFRDDLLSAAFASNLDGLVNRSGAALWVHGHTHDSFDYHVGDTRILCNPRGYTGHGVNPEFD